MNVLTVLLQAPAGAAGGGSMMWIMLIAMFVIMYFFMTVSYTHLTLPTKA
mgnify:CR=1 FL=1